MISGCVSQCNAIIRSVAVAWVAANFLNSILGIQIAPTSGCEEIDNFKIF